MFRQSSPPTVRQIPVLLELFDRRAPRPARFRSALALALLLVLPVVAQMPGPGPAPTPGFHPPKNQLGPGDASETGVGVVTHMESRRILLLNQIRQKALVSDAEKIVRLARELSDDANGSGTTLQAAERMRKTMEIEKLAKEVKEKMTYAIGNSPDLNGPFATFRP